MIDVVASTRESAPGRDPEAALPAKVVDVSPYRAQDAREMQLAPQAAESIRNLGDLDAMWVHYETMGPAWTLRVDGAIVACAGLLFMWPKPPLTPRVAHAWLLESPCIGTYPMTVVKTIVTRLRELIDQYGLVRVELEVVASFLKGNRFVQWLGFTRESEGLARRFGPNDEDFVRYELVQPRETP